MLLLLKKELDIIQSGIIEDHQNKFYLSFLSHAAAYPDFSSSKNVGKEAQKWHKIVRMIL